MKQTKINYSPTEMNIILDNNNCTIQCISEIIICETDFMTQSCLINTNIKLQNINQIKKLHDYLGKYLNEKKDTL